MLRHCFLVWLIAALLNVSGAYAHSSNQAHEHWDTVSPESLNVDGDEIDQFFNSINYSHDALIVRRGKVIAQSGDPEAQKDWASAMKVWLSTLALIMLDNGTISSLDETIDFPGLLGKDQGITWRSLMLMQSGYMHSESPMQKFAYNDLGISLFIAALRRKNGNDLNAVLRNNLAPLNLNSNIITSIGRSSASVTDYAKICHLLMNNGRWGNQQLLKKSSVLDAFNPIADKPLSLHAKVYKDDAYLNIPYVGGSSNQTISSGAGPNEYVFNGWLNTAGKNNMPEDFFHGNGHWGRTVGGFIPSKELVIVVRINEMSAIGDRADVDVGPIMENIHMVNDAASPLPKRISMVPILKLLLLDD